MDRGAWWATVHGVAKSGTRLSDFHFHFTKDIKLVIVPSYPFPMIATLSFFMMVVFVFSHFFLDQRRLGIDFFF